MAGQTLTTAYVNVIPTMKGAQGIIKSELGGVDTTSIGAKMGTGIGGGLKTSLSVASAAVIGIVSGLAQNAMSTVMGSLNAGIERADIINNFPRVMSNFGIGGDIAKASIDRLSTSLKGLPTGLDTAAAGVQRLVSKNGDLDRSTSLFLAMNNAVLAGGAPMHLQTTALEQLTQAYSKSHMDMIEWRTLQMAMPGQISQVAQAMGMSVESLGAGLRQNDKDVNYFRDVTMEEFMDTVARLNTEGVGEFLSFEQQAKNSTSGIQTSIANTENAISRGWQKILDSIGQDTIKDTFGNISSGIDAGAKVISGAITSVMPHVKGFFSMMGEGHNAATTITGIVSAYAGLKVVGPTLSGFSTILKGTGGDTNTLTGALSAAVGEFKTAKAGTETYNSALGVTQVTQHSFTGSLREGAAAFKQTEAGSKLLASASGALKGGLIAVGTAIVGMAIEHLVTGYMKAQENAKNLTTATSSLRPSIESATGAMQVAGETAGTVGGSYNTYKGNVDELIATHAKFVESMGESFKSTETNIAVVDGFTKTISSLAEQEGLTEEQQSALSTAVAGYNQITGESVSITDAVNGQLSIGKDELLKNAEAWKENARAQAMQEQLVALEKQKYENMVALNGALENLRIAQGAYDGAVAAGSEDGLMYQQQLEASKKAVEDLTASGEAYANQELEIQGYVKGSAEALNEQVVMTNAYIATTPGLLDALSAAGVNTADFSKNLTEAGLSTAQLKDMGIANVSELATRWGEIGPQIVAGLADGILSAEEQAALAAAGVSDSTIASLAEHAGTHSPSIFADAIGSDIVAGLGGGLSKTDAATSAAGSLGDSSLGAMRSVLTPDAAYSIGSSGAAGFGSGIRAQTDGTGSAGRAIAKEAAKEMQKYNGSSSEWGAHLVGGLASGMRGAIGNISGAANEIANTIRSVLHFTRPDTGPLRDYETWMPHFVSGMAEGLKNASPVLISQAESLAGDLVDVMDINGSVHIKPLADALVDSGNVAHLGTTKQADNSYNIYIDGQALASDQNLFDKFAAFMGDVQRSQRMGAGAY